MKYIRGDSVRRLWSKVDKSGDCWIWTGSVTSGGYGSLLWNGRARQAHQVVYELLVGPIPDGLELDHLCRVRHCVNPSHLEPVTRRENVRRGVSPVAVNARKTHCKRGHEFTLENTYARPDGARVCITCRRTQAMRRYYATRSAV